MNAYLAEMFEVKDTLDGIHEEKCETCPFLVEDEDTVRCAYLGYCGKESP
jgi:hypothetical protein